MSAPLSLALLAACEDDDVSGLLQGGLLLQQGVMEMASMAIHDAGSAMTVCRRLLMQQPPPQQLQALAEVLRALFDGPLSEPRLPPRARASLLREVCTFISSRDSSGSGAISVAAAAVAEVEAALSAACGGGPSRISDCVEIAGCCLPAAAASAAVADSIKRVLVTACSNSACSDGAGVTAAAEVLCTSAAASRELFLHVAAAVIGALQQQQQQQSQQGVVAAAAASPVAVVAACGRCVQFIAVKLSSNGLPPPTAATSSAAPLAPAVTWRSAAALWMDALSLALACCPAAALPDALALLHMTCAITPGVAQLALSRIHAASDGAARALGGAPRPTAASDVALVMVVSRDLDVDIVRCVQGCGSSAAATLSELCRIPGLVVFGDNLMAMLQALSECIEMLGPSGEACVRALALGIAGMQGGEELLLPLIDSMIETLCTWNSVGARASSAVAATLPLVVLQCSGTLCSHTSAVCRWLSHAWAAPAHLVGPFVAALVQSVGNDRSVEDCVIGIVRKESPSRDIHRRRLALIASQELLVLSAARQSSQGAHEPLFGEVLGCLRCLSQHGAAGFDDLFFMLCDALYRCRHTSCHALDAVADIVAHALEAICHPLAAVSAPSSFLSSTSLLSSSLSSSSPSSSAAAAAAAAAPLQSGGLNMKRCISVGLSVVAATISTAATIVACAPRSSPLRLHVQALLTSIVHHIWSSALQSQASGGLAPTDRAGVITIVSCMELIAAVAPCLVAAAVPAATPSSSLLQWCSVAAALAAAGRIDPSSTTRSHSCAVVAGGAVSLALCVISAAAAVEDCTRLRDGHAAVGGDRDDAALCKSAVAFTSYRASLVPCSPPWWRPPPHPSPSDVDMSPWLLPHAGAAPAPRAPGGAASPCFSSMSLSCAGFAAVLRGTTAFASRGVGLPPSAQGQPSVGGGSDDRCSAATSASQEPSDHSHQAADLTPCTLDRIEAILQRSHCSRALLMLLAKAWGWASLKAALSQFSSPVAGSSQALQCISSVFPAPLASSFNIPPATPLSSRLRGVAERLLDCSSPSLFHPITALCLALTSDVVIGMSSSAFIDACACVASLAAAAHESSSSNIESSLSSADSAICFTSALLILCAVADFNIRSSPLLRAALAASIACCCPRGRILLASSAFPCDLWGKRGFKVGKRVGKESSSGAEDDGDNAHMGGLSEVARAIQGQGGVFYVDELLGDDDEGASSRTAFSQVIGGEFVNQLMQHFTSEPTTFKALITSFSVLQPRFVRQCRQACSSGDPSEAFCRIPALLVELSVAACQLHAASSSYSAPSSASSAVFAPASRPLLPPNALIPLVANCVGACVALTALLLKRARWTAGQGGANAVGGAAGEAGDAAGAAVFTCVRLLLCISESDPVRCARLCPRMLRAASMASKCAPGTCGDALLNRSNSQLQLLLQNLAAAASADAEVGSDREEGGLIHSPAPIVRKGTKRRRFRSRNSVLDNWLADDKEADDAFDDLEDFLWQPGMPL